MKFVLFALALISSAAFGGVCPALPPDVIKPTACHPWQIGTATATYHLSCILVGGNPTIIPSLGPTDYSGCTNVMPPTDPIPYSPPQAGASFVTLGQTAKFYTTLTNLGGSPLILLGQSISGPQAVNFNIDPMGAMGRGNPVCVVGAPVAPGSSCLLGFNYTPIQHGVQNTGYQLTAVFEYLTNASFQPTRTIKLFGFTP